MSAAFTPPNWLRSLILGALTLALGLLIAKVLIDLKEEPPKSRGSAVRQVRAIEVKNGAVQVNIPITGRLQASERIELFAEVQGVLQSGSHAFRSGVRFKKGEIILQLDDSEARAAIVAQRSAFINTLSQALPDILLDYPDEGPIWNAYLLSLASNKPISSLPAVKSDTFRLFLTARGIPSAFHNLESAEVRLKKYAIKAPFDGVLTDALVSEGSLIRPGQALGTFIQPNVFELEASVPPRALQHLALGQSSHFQTTGLPGVFEGELVRINDKIDQRTQSVRIYFQIESDQLREGNYLSTVLATKTIDNAIELERRLLLNDRFIYEVKDSLLVRRDVEVQAFTEDKVVISGLPGGILILADQVPGAYDGMLVAPTSVAHP